MATARWSILESRFGRRMLLLFVLAALLPLLVAAALLTAEFSKVLAQRQQQDLDTLVRGYGMTLLGRLNSADDTTIALTDHSDFNDLTAQERLTRLHWVRSVRVVGAGSVFALTERDLPRVSAGQSTALARGKTALLWHRSQRAEPEVYLVRQSASGSLLYVEIDLAWLWGDIGDHAGSNALELRGPREQQFVGGGELNLEPQLRAPAAREPSRVRSSWEMFLDGRFSAPSWHVVGLAPAVSGIAGLQATRLVIPAVVLLAIVIVSLVSIRLIRRQLQPLGQLVAATEGIGRREFRAVEIAAPGKDEFAQLAGAFNDMAQNLRTQFFALETLSEVDRLLLHSPGLEQILDNLLPRIADVLHCCAVSVVLVDRDAPDHGRAYDHEPSDPQRRPVRRVALDIRAWRSLCDNSVAIDSATIGGESNAALAPLVQAGATRLRLAPLGHDQQIAGFLCLGYHDAGGKAAEPGVSPAEFADRLSVVLENLERAERLHEQAHYDSLTRLANRQLYRERIEDELRNCRDNGHVSALLYIDLDHFKRVNDTAGHTTGDELLRAVSRRLTSAVGDGDTVARLGGDEFAVLLPRLAEEDIARQVAERILESLQNPVFIDGREYLIGASIGVTFLPADGQTIEELLKHSDIAMYRAKESGRNQIVFFEPHMQERMRQRAALESGLYRAFQHAEFRLLYQPIIDDAVPAVRGVEALLRWPASNGGFVHSPAEFVPVAEESGLIVELGDWVLRTACQQFATWQQDGVSIDYLSVNVSVRQLKHADLIDRIRETLAACGMRPAQLQLEITESVLADTQVAAPALRELASLGVRIALDDFGTGFSSLSYLRTYPIDVVKIDKSFVTDIPHNPGACRLVESIVAMADALDKRVVAEGIETELQRAFIKGVGCTSMQGFLLGRPMEASDMAGYVRHVSGRAAPRTALDESPSAQLRRLG